MGQILSEWKKYKVGKPSVRPNWTESDCVPFRRVGHTSHVDSSLSILRGGKIKPGLVFDESRLNETRILVVWMSPNHWNPGYRYGGIKFDFDFREMVAGKNYFWVEAINYKPVACRILITDQDRSDELKVYDPTIGDGPWWYDSETDMDYFNGDLCLEFMFEREIPVSKLAGFGFVHHHREYCAVHRKTPWKCKELGWPAYQSGGAFLSRAIASNTSLMDIAHRLTEADGRLSSDLTGALGFVLQGDYDELDDFPGTGPIVPGDFMMGSAFARAVLNSEAIGFMREAQVLAQLFMSKRALVDAVAQLIAINLGLNDAEIRRRMLDSW